MRWGYRFSRRWLGESGRATVVWAVVAVLFGTPAVAAQEDSQANLAQQANNPIANLISLPFQYNANFDIGPNDRTQHVLSIQPVIPFELSKEWLLVTRWVLPIIEQPDVLENAGGTFGLGDLNPAFFFSPSSKLTGLPEGLVFGFGPSLQVPTATDSDLGADKWGIGPTALAVYAQGKWLVGALVSNTWSLGDRSDATKAMLLEPFITYNITDEWYLISDSVITADWNQRSSQRWVVPIGGGFGRTFSIAKQALNTNVQVYWNASDTDFGPKWNLVATFQLLFPK